MVPFEPQLSLQFAFHGKSALSVCSNGACEGTDKANFLIWGVQLVVRGTKHLYFERVKDEDIENYRISTNQTDKSGGDDGGGDGGRGRGRSVPRAVTVWKRAEDWGDGDNRQGWAVIPSVGREGYSSLQKWRLKTPHYFRVPPRRGLENRTPNLICHHP